MSESVDYSAAATVTALPQSGTSADDAPWREVGVPCGYALSANGVYEAPSKPNGTATRLAGPVWVTGRTRDTAGHNWGLLVAWLDSDGGDHEEAIAMGRLHEPHGTLIQELAAQGLVVVPGKERALMAYLAAFEPSQRRRSTDQVGWLADAEDRLTFVLPGYVIGGADGEDCYFQPERHSPSADTIRASGTLDTWHTAVAMRAVGNPFLVFATCLALAAPLLRPARLEAGGFHLYGRSSHGKTTAAQVAASVWGCGADPAEAPSAAYIRRWNATANALEGLAAAHNDGLLVLDELGTCGASDFGRIVYDLAGGQGKAAMTSERGMKKPRSWRVLVLSTGEVSVEQRIREDQRKQVQAGQQVRLMDVPAGEGVITAPEDGQTAGEFAQALKRVCSDHYGTAGPAFVEALSQQFATHGEFARAVDERLQVARTQLMIPGLSAEAARALNRLALVQAAGEWAAELTILPFSKDEVGAALRHIRDTWLADGGHITEGERGVRAVCEFVLRHRSRFADARDARDAGEPAVRDLAGYIDRTEQVYLFTRAGFAEACEGLDPGEVAEALKRHRLLVTNEARRQTVKRAIPALGGQRVRFYAVRIAILALEDAAS